MADVRKQKKRIERKISAQKRARQNVKRHLRNKTLVLGMRKAVKKLRAALTAKNKKEAETLLKPALSTIAKMVTQGMLHRNTAARYQSRLHR
ncbi:MAG: 30S ribosomal protein S20, partial [Deltaproteobacteria bacterium]|nr:30S ribosomal protein S20 [Deltaproteobacteria bacterium]